MEACVCVSLPATTGRQVTGGSLAVGNTIDVSVGFRVALSLGLSVNSASQRSVSLVLDLDLDFRLSSFHRYSPSLARSSSTCLAANPTFSHHWTNRWPKSTQLATGMPVSCLVTTHRGEPVCRAQRWPRSVSLSRVERTQVNQLASVRLMRSLGQLAPVGLTTETHLVLAVESSSIPMASH